MGGRAPRNARLPVIAAPPPLPTRQARPLPEFVTPPLHPGAMETNRWCGGCARETAYVRFDCTDHPDDCVELVCELCGAGLELAPVQGGGRRRRRAA